MLAASKFINTETHIEPNSQYRVCVSRRTAQSQTQSEYHSCLRLVASFYKLLIGPLFEKVYPDRWSKYRVIGQRRNHATHEESTLWRKEITHEPQPYNGNRAFLSNSIVSLVMEPLEAYRSCVLSFRFHVSIDVRRQTGPARNSGMLQAWTRLDFKVL